MDDWKWFFLEDAESAKKLASELMKKEEVTFDMETADPDTGLPTVDPYGCEVVLMSFCYDQDHAFVVPGEHMGFFQEFFESPDVLKIGHNLIFDAQVVEFNLHHPFKFAGFHGETKYMAWLENCEQQDKGKATSLKLKDQLRQKFKWDVLDFDTVWKYVPEGKKRAIYAPMSDVLYNPEHEGYNRDQALWYTAMDAFGDHQLYLWLKWMLQDRGYWDTYVNVDKNFLWMLWNRMERTGIQTDRKFFSELDAELEREQQRFAWTWSKLIHHDQEHELNPNSNYQLAHLVFRWGENPTTGNTDTCGCSAPHRPKKRGKANATAGKQGWPEDRLPSTGRDVLKGLVEEGCTAAYLVQTGKTSKTVRTNFVNRFLPGMEPEYAGENIIYAVHPGWNPIIRTGRISSRPNAKGLCGTMQNVPSNPAKDPYRIRRAFVARPGHVLLVLDYSQLELRILAHYSNDPNLLRAYREGLDIHSLTAVLAFGADCDVHEVKKLFPEKRSAAKPINFGIVYGISGPSVAVQIADITGNPCSPEQGDEYIQQWHNAYPGVQNYIDEQITFARENGYVRTISGRRRYLPDINYPLPTVRPGKRPTWKYFQAKRFREGAERQAQNTPIQGSAGDIMKLAQVYVESDKDLARMGAVTLLQVHDELVMEAPVPHAEEALEIVRHHMERSYADRLSVKLVAEGGIALSWEDAK